MIQLETQALIWLALAPEKLSARARSAVERASLADEKMAIAAITLWEIAQLTDRKMIVLNVALDQFLGRIEADFVVIPITATVAALAAGFPVPFPTDPMDRLIAASALANNCTLITADRGILESNACKLLW